MTLFHGLSQARSLAEAARSLGVSLPTVSRALTALEDRLGTRLLQRSSRGIVLTPQGRAFAEHCSRILEEVREAEHSARGLHAQACGQLSLAMPQLLGQQLLTEVMVDFLAAFDQVQIAARYTDEAVNLHAQGIDIALTLGTLPDSSAFAVRVGSVSQAVCATPTYLDHHGLPNSPEALHAHRIIHAGPELSRCDWQFGTDNPVLRLSPRLVCSTQRGAINAALHGLGLVRCLSHEIHAELEQDKLRCVLQAFAPPPLAVHLVYREGRKASARVRSFIDFAVPRLREHPALAWPDAP